MEFTGKIIAILQPRGGVSKSGNEWKSQEYVISIRYLTWKLRLWAGV